MKTPPNLTAAVCANDLTLVRKMIDNGEDLNEVTIGYSSPLHAAVCNAHFAIVDLLISHGANVHRGKTDPSPLGEALRRSRMDVVKRLLEAGVDIHNEPCALEYAVIGGSPEGIRLLLEKNICLKNGGYCLRKAAQMGRFSCVKILLAAGVDPHNHPDYFLDFLGNKMRSPETPRDAASKAGHKHIVSLLDGKKVSLKAALKAEQAIPLPLKFCE